MDNKINFDEFYGVRNLVIAPVTINADGTETWGEAQRLSGVQTISKEVTETSETHYYDNQGAIVVSTEGDDTYTLTVSVVDKRTRALIEGLSYDEATGALIGTKKNKQQYFALGYIAETVNGTEEFVWVYKGKFSAGSTTHNTKSDSVDTSNMEYTFTSIHTSKEFTNYGTAKFLAIDNNGLIDETKFFAKPVEPDTIADTYYDDISEEIVTVPEGTETFYEKEASELMANVSVKSNGSVTGTLLKVTGYTGFSSNPAEQSGHYFAFNLEKTGTLMTFRKNGVAVKTNIAWEATNVFRVENINDTFDVLVDGILAVSFNFRNVILA